MSHRLPALVLATLAALSASLAFAQAGASGPTAAAAPAFRSALDGYEPFSDEKVVPWRDANDNVGRIGGWRAYAKEAQEEANGSKATPASPATSGSSAKPVSPASAPAHPHSGHGKQ